MSEQQLREYFEKKYKEEWYTVEVLARMLNVSTQTIYNWRDEGKIILIWEGSWKILKKDLIDFLVNKN